MTSLGYCPDRMRDKYAGPQGLNDDAVNDEYQLMREFYAAFAAFSAAIAKVNRESAMVRIEGFADFEADEILSREAWEEKIRGDA